jgi:hypothetical protein
MSQVRYIGNPFFNFSIRYFRNPNSLLSEPKFVTFGTMNVFLLYINNKLQVIFGSVTTTP